jgi:hypothetical protein
VDDEEVRQGIVVGGRWPEVLLTMTCGDGGWLGDQRGVGTARCCGPLGRDDRAGLVRYVNSSANFKALLLMG